VTGTETGAVVGGAVGGGGTVPGTVVVVAGTVVVVVVAAGVDVAVGTVVVEAIVVVVAGTVVVPYGLPIAVSSPAHTNPATATTAIRTVSAITPMRFLMAGQVTCSTGTPPGCRTRGWRRRTCATRARR
jgi:hypothetical protein